MPERRKVCVVVASRANYARIKSVLQAVNEREDSELQLVVGASALLERFGSAVDVIERDGFKVDALIRLIIEGQTPTTMAKSTGLGLLELPTILEQLKPDVVVTVADRFETIATAIAAAYMNVPVAHTQGGDVSGSIDESVRHAVTKLAHLHFPATELRPGGCSRWASGRTPCSTSAVPRSTWWRGPISAPATTRSSAFAGDDSTIGAGAPIDPDKPFVLMMQHPVTTEYGQGLDQIEETLDAVPRQGMQALVFWPNVDAGSEDGGQGDPPVPRGGRRGAAFTSSATSRPRTSSRLMAHCSCMVGNSSAALREGVFLGTPAVSIGSRQQNRECGENVAFVGHEADEIADAVRDQIAHGRYERDELFGDGTAGREDRRGAGHGPPAGAEAARLRARGAGRARRCPRTDARAGRSRGSASRLARLGRDGRLGVAAGGVLVPGPGLQLSVSGPPSRLSLPGPPMRRSLPGPPKRASSPASPSRKSSPSPPERRSFSSPPSRRCRRSLVVSRRCRSFPAPPERVSSPVARRRERRSSLAPPHTGCRRRRPPSRRGRRPGRRYSVSPPVGRH